MKLLTKELEQKHSAIVLLKVLGKEDSRKSGEKYGLFKCFCGSEFKTRLYSVRSGKAKSCGCLRIKKSKERATKHGKCNHRLYSHWGGMRTRTSEKSQDKSLYFDRGIGICERWNDVENFISDMDSSYCEGMTLDRRDNDKGYSIDNCRWVSQSVQSQNTRLICKRNTSGYRGVSFVDSGKFQARVTINEEYYYLGRFDTREEAAIAYNNCVIEKGGENPLNIIGDKK